MKVDNDRWVESRLASLQPVRGFRPDAAKAFTAVWERDRVYRVRRRRWAWIAVAASVASLSVLAIPGRCDAPRANSCSQPLAGRLWNQVFSKPAELTPPPAVVPAPAAVPLPTPAAPPPQVAENRKPTAPQRPQTAAKTAAAVTVNFKEAGSPAAPVVVEIYTDYECPVCAVLYQQTVPALMAQYVQTGKVRLLHRDFPLPQHAYARLAARYANAAGRLGQYDQVVNYLFQTQNLWAEDGSVDKQVAQVLAPGLMQKVRDLVQNDATLDDTVAADVAMGMQDGINRTPTMVFVAKGKRQPFPGVPDPKLLQTYLDQLLSK